MRAARDVASRFKDNMKRVICDIDRCMACRSCELACWSAHAPRGATPRAVDFPAGAPLSAPLPRVRVQAVDAGGSIRRTRALALQCRRCGEPACAEACISGGLQKDASRGVTLDPKRCVACWSCIMVCPFGAVRADVAAHHAVLCDLCEGREEPACVAACPTGALKVEEDTRASRSARRRRGRP